MARGVRVVRLAILSLIILLVIFKLSTDRVDLSNYVASKGPKIEKSSPDQKAPAMKDPSGLSSGSNGIHNQEGQPLSGSNMVKQDQQANLPTSNAPYQRANATFVTLARNDDLWDLVATIKQIEDRFNHKYNYDWVFLNNGPFDDKFKKIVSNLISGKTKFEVIPDSMWSYPDWIDQDKAAKTRKDMQAQGVIYGGSESYRHMCRFESGFFYRHPALDEYKYYWRVDPHIKLHCDIEYDLFKYMEEKGKKYGFTISMQEYIETIPTLWESTKRFIKKYPQFLPKNNLMEFVSNDGGETYNKCHFWSNFEIASLDFWRDEAYSKYFDHLDQDGGFFYERWGDAPVHSIAAALFLEKDEIHFFDDVGYYHLPFHSCPTDEDVRYQRKCICKPEDNFTWKSPSCTPRYYDVKKLERPKGWREQT